MRVEDAALRSFCVSAYNDGVAELQARAGGRLLPQALIPFWDVKLAVKELVRCQDELKLSGFTMTDSPEAWGQPSLNDSYRDPLWAVAQERGLPVKFHIGSGGTGGMVWGGMDIPRTLASISTILFMNNMMVETDFPHPTCLYPGPRKKIEQALAPLPVEAQRKLLYENAARVYHLDLAGSN